MKKTILKILSTFLVISLLVYTLGISVIALDDVDSVDKVYCEATLDDEFTDNEILVIITPENNFEEYTADDFSEIGCIDVEDLSIDPEEDKLCRILHLTLSIHSKENVLNAISILEEREDIYSAEPNYLGEPEATPNDEYCDDNLQWLIDKIQLTDAWDIETGSDSVKVGIIDTGIDIMHPDLIGRVNLGLSESFVSHYSSPVSNIVDGHGTHVAGIIGAQGNNSIGISGVCWNVDLVSLRVDKLPDSEGKIYWSLAAIIAAIQYADEKGIDILNFSGGFLTAPSEYIYAIELQIENFDGLFVCAAGNEYKNNDIVATYPSNFSLDNLISVGASTSGDTKRENSNYGKTTVDIFAPGENIYSTFNGEYGIGSGTSMAAPVVAGVAALLLSAHPELTAQELKAVILSSVDVVYDGNGNNVFGNLCVSGGRINAYKALNNNLLHNYSYISTSSTSHNCVCSTCGYQKPANHTWSYSSVNSREHRLSCIYCSHQHTESHSFNLITGKCKMCGYNSNDMGTLNRVFPLLQTY